MMHEPIQAKGPTMSEQLMEQYRLRGQRKCRNACIAAIVTVVLVLAVAGGVWWTAGDGSALVRNMFKPKATPATQPVVNRPQPSPTAPHRNSWRWKPATEAPAM